VRASWDGRRGKATHENRSAEGLGGICGRKGGSKLKAMGAGEKERLGGRKHRRAPPRVIWLPGKPSK